VLAAVQGSADLALGNAVGSILCDTGLILGIAALIAPLPLDRAIVNRQGWVQLGSGVLLVVACLPFTTLGTTLSTGGRLPQIAGLGFLGLLGIYLWLSVRWTRDSSVSNLSNGLVVAETGSTWIGLVKLIVGIGIVVGSSWILIPAVREAAMRLHSPQSIIAATLVAFGTSLPELVTAVTAARRGHGELAVGNVVGADILNVFFVAGAAAAVTAGGLPAASYFFRLLFSAMLVVLVVFRCGIFLSGSTLKRPFGVVLIGMYIAVTAISYVWGIEP
jgi:cation:H+ antiporter